eukprot:1157982-Pelagomonas_calceolata.AAC.2
MLLPRLDKLRRSAAADLRARAREGGSRSLRLMEVTGPEIRGRECCITDSVMLHLHTLCERVCVCERCMRILPSQNWIASFCPSYCPEDRNMTHNTSMSERKQLQVPRYKYDEQQV